MKAETSTGPEPNVAAETRVSEVSWQADAASFKRVPALDGIRGIAIVWVVVHNTTNMALDPPPHGVFRFLTLFAHTGWIGVELFFALSGFLITAGLVDSQGGPDFFRNFYAKRALRILPLYYLTLFALLIVLPRIITPGPPFSTEYQSSLWLFTLNWTHRAPYGFAHFWSLAVEEQFYLFWPLVVWRLPAARLLKVCLWIAVGALLLRSVLLAFGASGWTLYTSTLCRMDALSLGGAGACAVRLPGLMRWLRDRTAHLGAATALLFLVGIPLTHAYSVELLAGQTVGYSVLAICGAVFVTLVVLSAGRGGAGINAVLTWAPLRSCGRYSYAMYIFHNLLHKLIGEPRLLAVFGEHLPAAIAFVYAGMVLMASYVLGFASYHLLEKHFLRLKRLFTQPSAHVLSERSRGDAG